MVRRLVFLLCLPASVFAQPLSREQAAAFARDLLGNRRTLQEWFAPEDLVIAHRLGIEYDGVAQKHLIGYDFDDSVKSLVRNRRTDYSIRVDTLDQAYARVRVTVDHPPCSREYYFHGKRCISPFAYFARHWAIVESQHFRFILSDSNLFNSYCLEHLETFLTHMVALLELNPEDVEVLRREKIRYYLCKDEDEIEQLTGFRVRGMCNLAYDAVVTTYNAHYHELLHLLINYKLRHLPLYTHPFFQEGFAVAYGGRGGLEPGVVLSLGRFLYQSGYVELPAMLDQESFRQLDPSLSYPAAGLYNMFLLETMGIQSYLRLYRTYSHTSPSPGTVGISPEALPADTTWRQYIRQSQFRGAVALDATARDARTIVRTDSLIIAQDTKKYHFSLRDHCVVQGPMRYPDYSSRAYREACPGEAYRGEKYLIRASAEEISVYNLFTNNLIANYVTAFATPAIHVPCVDGMYRFSIRKDIFDEPLEPILFNRRPEDK